MTEDQVKISKKNSQNKYIQKMKENGGKQIAIWLTKEEKEWMEFVMEKSDITDYTNMIRSLIYDRYSQKE